jgi:hypothetical protein
MDNVYVLVYTPSLALKLKSHFRHLLEFHIDYRMICAFEYFVFLLHVNGYHFDENS